MPTALDFILQALQRHHQSKGREPDDILLCLFWGDEDGMSMDARGESAHFLLTMDALFEALAVVHGPDDGEEFSEESDSGVRH